MSGSSEDVGRRALRLLKNILILYFALFLCRSIEPYLQPFLRVKVGTLVADSELIFTFISLLLLIYFGYFILIDVRFFLNLASKIVSAWLVGEEKSRVRLIAYDAAVIIALILLHELLIPLARGVQTIGEPLATAIQIGILAIGLLILYHLAGQAYYLTRSRVERLVRNLTERFSRKNSEDEVDGK